LMGAEGLPGDVRAASAGAAGLLCTAVAVFALELSLPAPATSSLPLWQAAKPRPQTSTKREGSIRFILFTG